VGLRSGMPRPRVLLLRPPDAGAGPLAEAAVVANIPVIDIEPVEGALDVIEEWLSRCSLLVVTSPRAPRLLKPLAERIRELQRGGSLRIAAVGPRTAEEAERLGLRVDHVPREYRGKALAEELARLEPKPRCVLLPRSEKALPDLRRGLEEAGIEVIEVPLYRPVVLDDMASLAAAVADRFDYVVFTSPSIAEAFTRHYRSPARPGFQPVAIGPSTARKLVELGYPEPPYPAVYTMEGVAGLIERLEVEKRAGSRVGGW